MLPPPSSRLPVQPGEYSSNFRQAVSMTSDTPNRPRSLVGQSPLKQNSPTRPSPDQAIDSLRLAGSDVASNRTRRTTGVLDTQVSTITIGAQRQLRKRQFDLPQFRPYILLLLSLLFCHWLLPSKNRTPARPIAQARTPTDASLQHIDYAKIPSRSALK